MLERRRYRFRLLSPLHIGSGDVLLPATDFVFKEGRIFVLDWSSLARELATKGLLTVFSRNLSQEGRRFDLRAFLDRNGLYTYDFLRRHLRYEIAAKGNPREIRAFIKSKGYPYVPGSSIKGALRVGMLYRLLKELLPRRLGQSFLEDFVYKKLERRLGRLSQGVRPGRLRKEMGRFLDELLSAFRLKEDRNNPRTDLLRCLRVSDSGPLNLSQLEVLKVEARRLNGKASATTFVEALCPGTSFYVDLWIDQELLETFGRENRRVSLPSAGEVPFELYQRLFSEPFQPVALMVKELLTEEKDRLPPQWITLKEGTPNFRFGWGQGLLSATVFMLLPPELRQRIRNELFRDKGKAEAPSTRKVSPAGLMGFCEVARLKL